VFWWGALRGRHHLEDLGIDGKIILKCIFMKWDEGGMDWTNLAQDRDRRWAPVNAVINRRFTYNAGSFLTSCRRLSFSERTPFP
jgi:hypothetical protein